MTVSSVRRTTTGSIPAAGMLREGSRGPEVAALQKALAASGFDPHGFDGWFGPKTRAAVIAFQTARHLTVDGLVGPQTWGALRSAAPAPAVATLSVGSRGPEVVDLQKALYAAGFDPHGLDGSFGPKTQAAVSAFQSAHRLPVTGRADQATRLALAFTKPVGGTTGASGSGRIAGMLAWARSMQGAKYAAVSPFRFGDVLWDGKAHTSENGSGTVWNYPKGTRVFDCSGFVVAAFRRAGVDLAAHGLTSSGLMAADTRFLQTIPREQLQPGDVITYSQENGIGHVVLYLGNGLDIECAGGVGVVIRPVDWSRASAFKRVPLP